MTLWGQLSQMLEVGVENHLCGPATPWADKGRGQHSHTHALKADSSKPPSPGPALLRHLAGVQGPAFPSAAAAAAGEGWAQLPRVLHSVRVKTSSAQPLDIHMVAQGLS